MFSCCRSADAVVVDNRGAPAPTPLIPTPAPSPAVFEVEKVNVEELSDDNVTDQTDVTEEEEEQKSLTRIEPDDESASEQPRAEPDERSVEEDSTAEIMSTTVKTIEEEAVETSYKCCGLV